MRSVYGTVNTWVNEDEHDPRVYYLRVELALPLVSQRGLKSQVSLGVYPVSVWHVRELVVRELWG